MGPQEIYFLEYSRRFKSNWTKTRTFFLLQCLTDQGRLLNKLSPTSCLGQVKPILYKFPLIVHFMTINGEKAQYQLKGVDRDRRPLHFHRDELGAGKPPLFPNGSPFGDPGPHGDLFGDLGPLWVPFLCFGSPFSLFLTKRTQNNSCPYHL